MFHSTQELTQFAFGNICNAYHCKLGFGFGHHLDERCCKLETGRWLNNSMHGVPQWGDRSTSCLHDRVLVGVAL